jgi:hypothetical protein
LDFEVALEAQRNAVNVSHFVFQFSDESIRKADLMPPLMVSRRVEIETDSIRGKSNSAVSIRARLHVSRLRGCLQRNILLVRAFMGDSKIQQDVVTETAATISDSKRYSIISYSISDSSKAVGQRLVFGVIF